MTIHFFLRTVLLLAVMCHSAYAKDINGTWQLHGTVQMDVSIKNKKQTRQMINNAILNLGTQKHFVIDGQAFQLSGLWTSKTPTFQGRLDRTSVNVFLANIATDLRVKSGLIVKPVTSNITFSGTELADSSIKGEWHIISKITFPKQTADTGVLHISYRFTGQRLK